MEDFHIRFGTDQTPALEKLLEKLEKEGIVSHYKKDPPEKEYVAYMISFHTLYGIYKFGYECTDLMKYI